MPKRPSRPFLEPAQYALIGLLLGSAACAAAADEAVSLYHEHCAQCHGADRLGGSGPALLPENLSRTRPESALQAITGGLPATQMPGFAATLSAVQIRLLADFIFTPLPEKPRWGIEEIRASRAALADPPLSGTPPVHGADPLNLFVVVEAGTHHVSILDGDRFKTIYRFKSRFALHGGPKFSPDGRFVYFASRDGWISKFDLYSLKMLVEVRAGINTRNLAASSDGGTIAVANYLPHTLVILDAADLTPLKLIPVEDESGRSSRVSAVYDAAPRQSFIAALKDLPEVFEISYAKKPPFYGRVHDYRDEGPPTIAEPFPVRRILLDDYLDDFFLDPGYRHLIGAARNGRNGQVVNLSVGRKIADVALTGLPHLGSGITWNWQGVPVMATPDLRDGSVTVIDMRNWQVVKRIGTLGPGFFLRSHESTRYAWVDIFSGENKDAMQLIDKQTLSIAHTLRPEPGKTSAHVEFTRDGKYALVSIWEDDGAIVVYDAQTLREVTRLPMDKPSGKYNVYNKISGSSGTSH